MQIVIRAAGEHEHSTAPSHTGRVDRGHDGIDLLLERACSFVSIEHPLEREAPLQQPACGLLEAVLEVLDDLALLRLWDQQVLGIKGARDGHATARIEEHLEALRPKS